MAFKASYDDYDEAAREAAGSGTRRNTSWRASVMTDRYERIRKALEMGPTPWPWKAHDPSESGWMDITNSPYATPLCYAVPYSDYQYDAELDCERLVRRAHETPANAAYIAACDPDTIRALLAERDALARDAERYRWLKKSAFCNVWERGDGIALVVPRTPTASIDSKIDAEMAMENSND